MKRALQRRAVLTAVLAGAGLCALTACAGGSDSANKAGAKVAGQVTLRLEMPDAAEPRGLFFAQAVARRSGGSVRIRIDEGRYSSGHMGSELALAHALEGGHEEIAYLPARAWASAGLPAFQALLAPFLITTGAAGQRVATGPIATRVLASLPRSVVGLALVPDEPRRVLARYPLSSLAAFSGLRIQPIGNPRAAAAFAALGAVPAQGLTTTAQIKQAVFSGSLDAVESSPSTILANAYFTRARYLSAYSVFPKFASIVLARATWQRLSPAQRAAVRAAAADTVAAAGRQLPAQQRTELTQLCQAQVKIAPASRAALATLQEASESSLTPLVGDPVSASVLSALYRLPGSGAQPLATPLPATCRGVGAAAAASASASSSFPEGTYTVTDTAADFRQGDVTDPDFRGSITVKTTLRDGRWQQTQVPNFPDQGPFSGTYAVHGDEVVFTMLRAGVHGENSITAPETVRWSYFDGVLRFAIVSVADSGSRVLYAAHPWRKLG